MAGHVYLLSNPSMPGLVKVGFTERPLEERLAELSAATGVPTPFVIEYSILVEDQCTAEEEIHAALDAYRVNDGREFFRVEAREARRALQDKFLALTLAQLIKLNNDSRTKLIDMLISALDDDSVAKLIEMVFRKRPTVRNNLK
jgi:hypothetical protein